jgi:hypothetical protein
MILGSIGVINSGFDPSLPSGEVFTSPSSIGSAVSVVAQSPFVSGNSYSFSSSVNSYLSVNPNNSWSVGTGDYTVEWFSYQTTLAQFQRIFSVGDYPDIAIGASIESGTFYYWIGNSSSPRRSISSATVINTWYHWAISRENGITKIFKNGVQQGPFLADTFSATNTVLAFIVGNTNTFATNAAFVGYLTNFRFVKGLAVYTGNFTTPTSSLSLISSANPYGGLNTQAIPDGYTKLLLVP